MFINSAINKLATTKSSTAKSPTTKSVLSRILAVTALATITASAGAMAAPEPHPLAGSWQMDSAWETLADGRRVTTYTEHPDGLLLIDANGRYSLQIFHPKRKKFAGSKASGSAEEFKDAVIGSSTHFGTISLEPKAQQLVFHIDAASYPKLGSDHAGAGFHAKRQCAELRSTCDCIRQWDYCLFGCGDVYHKPAAEAAFALNNTTEQA